MGYFSKTIDQPKTPPTIKSLPIMNRRSLRNWEFKLGLTQVVALIGVMLGSLACAFYLGFFSGRSAGVQLALSNAASDVVRYPLSPDQAEENGSAKEQTTAEVYAKLNQTGGFGNDSPRAQGAQAANRRDLAPIKNADAAPLIDELMVEEKAPVKAAANVNKPDPLADIEKPSAAPASGKLLRDEIPDADQPPPLKAVDEQKPSAVDDQAVAAAAVAAEPKALEAQEEKPVEAAKPEAPRAPVAVAKANVAPPPSVKPEKKEAVKPAPASQGGFVRKVIPQGWYAQVAAPGKLDDANAIAQKLHQAGFAVMIENADVRGQQYFRVIVGPEDNRQHAERLVGQLKREKSVHGDPFIKVVK
jgi:cell division septation protein DedD